MCAAERPLEQLERQEGAPDLGDPRSWAAGRRCSRPPRRWRHLGPLFHVEQAMTALGAGSRQAVSDLARRGRLLALDAPGGRKLYPAFQPARAGARSRGRRRPRNFRRRGRRPAHPRRLVHRAAGAAARRAPAAWMRARRDPHLSSKRRAAPPRGSRTNLPFEALPPPPADLAGFPARRLRPSPSSASSAPAAPWWFSHDGAAVSTSGRAGHLLPGGGAGRSSGVRPWLLIPEPEVAVRRVSRLGPPAARCCSPTARRSAPARWG